MFSSISVFFLSWEIEGFSFFLFLSFRSCVTAMGDPETPCAHALLYISLDELPRMGDRLHSSRNCPLLPTGSRPPRLLFYTRAGSCASWSQHSSDRFTSAWMMQSVPAACTAPLPARGSPITSSSGGWQALRRFLTEDHRNVSGRPSCAVTLAPAHPTVVDPALRGIPPLLSPNTFTEFRVYSSQDTTNRPR